MSNAYVVGHISVKDNDLWSEYRSKVSGTLLPWQGEVLLRSKPVATLAGENSHLDIVVISFPSLAALNGWFSSPAYQALIPLREQAAEMAMRAYEA
ncbi:DUF1330 domain-containing protein [Pseudomonas sp. C1C7]|uniref:DUF1330 domain-containing protein n=1 Tax=Pseudomonas sp. C1C7 TaxID=2735272 RepID=UPI001585E1C7|nr:DUF1330 domain-containing protein [Pseudomonas sp. C1C7]NUT77616.1 DUF1330 domain-containing protein [Pseudomonas sp. C1C7]